MGKTRKITQNQEDPNIFWKFVVYRRCFCSGSLGSKSALQGFRANFPRLKMAGCRHRSLRNLKEKSNKNTRSMNFKPSWWRENSFSHVFLMSKANVLHRISKHQSPALKNISTVKELASAVFLLGISAKGHQEVHHLPVPIFSSLMQWIGFDKSEVMAFWGIPWQGMKVR